MLIRWHKSGARIVNEKNLTPEALQNMIQQEIEKKINRNDCKHKAYWWTSNIAELRRQLQADRREKQRLRRSGGDAYNEAVENYVHSRQRLNNEIKKSKKEYWSKLCEDLNNDP